MNENKEVTIIKESFIYKFIYKHYIYTIYKMMIIILIIIFF